MKNFFSKPFVALLTFFLGIFVTSIFLIFYKPVEKKFAEPNLENNKQSVKPKPTPKIEESKPELKSLSPYDIESFITSNPKTEIQNIWDKLKIADKYNEDSSDGNNRFFASCGYCEAQTYEFELDGQTGAEVLLRIEDRSQEASRYLVFKYKNTRANENEWQLLGNIDHDFGRHQMPQHSFLLSGAKSWLVIRVQQGSGSGVSLYGDRLFTIWNNKLEEILNYTAEGHQSGMGVEPSRNFSGHILDCKIENNIAAVEVEFAVDYSTFDDTDNDIPLWSKKQRAIFRKNLKSNKTKLETKKSSLSERELEAVYNIDSLTAKDLLKYNFEELKKIAIGKRVKQRQWLRNFLQISPQSKEKTALRRILLK